MVNEHLDEYPVFEFWQENLMKPWRKLMELFLIGVLLSSSLSGCAAGSAAAIPAGLTLGVALNTAIDHVKSVIDRAATAARSVIIQAGTEAYNTIESAQVAYADSLDRTIEQLDAATTQKLQEIKSMVDDLESFVDSRMANVLQTSQQIVNTLPLANTFPQVTRFSPSFITNGKGFELDITGNFVNAHQQAFKATLQFAGATYTPAQNTTQSLKFVLPAPPSVAPNTLQIMTAVLSMPYETSILHTHKDSAFNLMLVTVPPSPGRVTFETSRSQVREERSHYVTPQFYQDSSNDDLDLPHEGPPPPEHCRIDGATVRFIEDWSQGGNPEHWHENLIRTNPTVIYQLWTVHRGVGTSGKVRFHYEYELLCKVTQTVPQSETVTLNWGDSKSFPIDNQGWKAHLDAFDGTSRDFVNTVGAAEYRFLRIQASGHNVLISAPDLSGIR